MANKFIYKNFILNENEEVIKIIRQSKGVIISKIILPIILIIGPFFFLWPLFQMGNIGIIIFFLLIISGLFILIRNLFIWYFKILVVTNQKIVDIDQQRLLHKIVSDIPLEKIQDIFYRIKGLNQTLTGVGDIQIVLTDNKTRIELENIKQPQKIQQIILQLRLENMEYRLEETKLSAQELLNLVKKIKNGIGEEEFKRIIGKNQENQ